MKNQAIAIAALGACALFASAQGSEITVNCIFTLPIAELTATITTTVITTVTDENGNIVKESKVTTKKDVDTISPDYGDYTYEEYGGVLLPYYKGYYYIDGAWVWRGSGVAPIPPPKFRPHPAPKAGAAKAAASAKAVSAKPTAGLRSSPAKTASGVSAPLTAAPIPPRTVRAPKAPKAKAPKAPRLPR